MTGKTQVTGSTTLSVHYAYDAAGQLASITYPSGRVVQFGYAAGLLTDIAVDGTAILSNIGYQPLTHVPNGWTWGNGTAYVRTFDQDGRITSYPLATRTRTLQYDDAGRITGYLDTDSTQSRSFSHDADDRLTQFTSPLGTEQYSYDAVGNRLGLGTTFAGANDATYAYSGPGNRLTSVTAGNTRTYAYDPTGNTLGDGVSQFSFDGSNRLSQVTNSSGVYRYFVNGMGQRVEKLTGPAVDLAGDANQDGRLDTTDLRLIMLMARGYLPVNLVADCNHDGSVTLADVSCTRKKIVDMRMHPENYVSTGRLFVYDEAGHLIGEYNQDGTPVEETLYLGDLPVAVLAGGNSYFVYADHLGAPRVIVNVAGTPVWDWEGAPFGSDPANPDPAGTGMPFTYNLRLPGQYYDAETGLHYNGLRDYDPASGRYIESDPTGLAGGVNTYAYVSGRPEALTDPAGLQQGSANTGCYHQVLGEGGTDLQPVPCQPAPAPQDGSSGTNWSDALSGAARRLANTAAASVHKHCSRTLSWLREHGESTLETVGSFIDSRTLDVFDLLSKAALFKTGLDMTHTNNQLSQACSTSNITACSDQPVLKEAKVLLKATCGLPGTTCGMSASDIISGAKALK